MSKLDEIEGIGPSYGAKLAEAGLQTTADLLAQCGTADGRKAVAEKAGVSETLLLEWTNRADLMRLKGVGSEYSDLLEAAGVDTVVELAQRNAANLTAKLTDVNAEKKLVRALPSESQVAGWIAEAGTLDRAVHH